MSELEKKVDENIGCLELISGYKGSNNLISLISIKIYVNPLIMWTIHYAVCIVSYTKMNKQKRVLVHKYI